MLLVFKLKSHSLSEGSHIKGFVKTLLNSLLVAWDLGIDVSEVANLTSCLGNFVEEDSIVRGREANCEEAEVLFFFVEQVLQFFK